MSGYDGLSFLYTVELFAKFLKRKFPSMSLWDSVLQFSFLIISDLVSE